MGACVSDLDVITIGRSSVDLYGGQVGGRLEDMATFAKYIGGSPTNMAAGTARLGLKSALLTRVGDEPMGRFIREELERTGVDVAGVVTDPERLTALVLLGIRDQSRFPLIFYRENCADMALSEDDVDPAFIARARAVVATGTHLSHPRTTAAVVKALTLARENGAATALDIDYRPNLWGLAGHDAGEERFIESQTVTEKLQALLPLFDLVVGTEEEFHIAGGSTDTARALEAVRAVTPATLVLKRGPMGAVAFTGAVPADLTRGCRARVSPWRSSMFWAPGTVSCRGFCAAGCAARHGRRASPGRTPAGRSPSAGTAAPRPTPPGRSSGSSSAVGS